MYIRCKGRDRATLISIDDLETVKQIPTTWYGVIRNCTMYVQACFGKPLRYVYMHRLIMGAKPVDYVDHANNDGMDNSRENLAIVSAKENNNNRRLNGRWNRLTITALRWYEEQSLSAAACGTDDRGYIIVDSAPLPWEM